ncbi:hypothetical protein G7Z17_g10826 [Cylindrodendrum hubeiense]|uniref:Azaphilone pigments biosynthesis cluster protein L N-terminal domain-containing protein n=1 Tax=Cylindrodendrum hubeiense TaxID=595255 RepID=A0A9P5H6D9_9HYPO|nr:hypothetical protein G7Z17_g10826 [Cylindrodendrum hubeiense]
MADPLSVISGIAGVIAFATATTQTLVSLIQAIKDAPQEILELRLELDSLSSVLQSAKQLCATYEIRVDDATLIETVTGCLQHSSSMMDSLKITLQQFVDDGNWRRRSRRAFSWTMRKGDIKTLRSRFRDGTARLTLAVSVLNGHLTGKGQDEIRKDIAVGYEKLSAQIQSSETGKRLRMKLESDLESVTAGRRGSKSAVTDADLPMRRYFEQKEDYDFSTESMSTDAWPVASPDSADEPLLIKAARTGNKHLIFELVLSGISTMERGHDGRTALHYAAIHDDSETARLLLDHRAEVNAKDNALDTPFKLATSGEFISIQVAAVLIEKACVIGDFASRLVGLMAAAEDPGSLRPLISPIEGRRSRTRARGPFLLHQAVTIKDNACLKILLEEGLDTEQLDGCGLSHPILTATSEYRLTMIKDISPVMHATLHHNRAAIQLLVDYGANINVYLPRFDPSPVEIKEDYLKRLPEQSMHGETPLSLSAYWNDVGLAQYLLQIGANPNFVFPDFDQQYYDLDTLAHAQGETLLNRCCSQHLLGHAKLLIKAGVNVNLQILSTGENPLYWCIICGNLELLHILIENGIDVNLSLTSKEGGKSALHTAVQYDQIEMARVLIEHGADVGVKNADNETPLEQAQNSGKDRFIALFERTV